jgi:hypothetical protein
LATEKSHLIFITRKKYMKNLLLATALVAVSSTAAFAEGGLLSSISPDASVEYAVDAKTWSGDVGVTTTFAGITIRPAADFSYSSGNSLAIDSYSVKGTMPLSSGLSAYSKLSMTNKMKYSEVTVGVAFSF